MAYKSQVIADSSGQWCGNALVFLTKREAEEYVKDLAWRWVLVRDTRVIETDEPPNYRFEGGHLIKLP